MGYVVGRKCVRDDLILLVFVFLTVFNFLSSGAGQPSSQLQLSSTISHYLFVCLFKVIRSRWQVFVGIGRNQ